MSPPTLTILDVGHGNCAVLEHEGRVAVLDAGSQGAAVSFLEERKLGRIDLLLLSHSDADHIDGALSLIIRASEGLLQIAKIRVNSDAKKDSKLWDDFCHAIDRLQRRGSSLDYKIGLHAGLPGEYSVGGVTIDVVAPSLYLTGKGVGNKDSRGRRITSNSLSAVLRLSFAGRPLALLPGDLDEIGLDDLESHGASLAAELLVYPHHGGAPSGLAARLMDRVRPSVVVFSVGRKKYSNPQPAIIETIRRCAPDVWIACTQLSPHCATEVPPRSPGHLALAPARGREGRECCAGSIVIQLGTQVFTPAREHHLSFVRQLGPSVLCQKALSPTN